MKGHILSNIIKKRNKLKCRECGGSGKPSTGIVNTHNIRIAGAGEFTTSMVKCLKCKDCGHSWVNEKEPNTPNDDFSKQENALRDCLDRIHKSRLNGELPSSYDIHNAFIHVNRLGELYRELLKVKN